MSERTRNNSGTYYAFGRMDRFSSMAPLKREMDHANRAPGATFTVRPGTSTSDQLRWLASGDPAEFDLRSAYKGMRASLNARERAGSAFVLHLQLSVTPEWVEEIGGLHDRDNPRNRALFDAAVEFTRHQRWHPFAARLDLDEVGGGVVDVYCCPAFYRKGRPKKDGTRGADVPELSVNKALQELRRITGEKSDGSALQTAWATFAKKHLDPALQRGRRKSETGREHLETPEYKRVMEELKMQRGELAQVQEALELAQRDLQQARREKADIAYERDDLRQERELLKRNAATIEAEAAKIRKEQDELNERQAVIEEEGRTIKARQIASEDELLRAREAVAADEKEARALLQTAKDQHVAAASKLDIVLKAMDQLKTYIAGRLSGAQAHDAIIKTGIPVEIKAAIAAFDNALDQSSKAIAVREARVAQREKELAEGFVALEKSLQTIDQIKAATVRVITYLQEKTPQHPLLRQLLSISELAATVVRQRVSPRNDGREM